MDEPYVGMVCLFPWDWAPLDWAKCDGQLLPIAQYQALFSLIGIKFGGDGQNNFMLPKIPGVQAETGTLSYYISLQGMYPRRD